MKRWGALGLAAAIALLLVAAVAPAERASAVDAPAFGADAGAQVAGQDEPVDTAAVDDQRVDIQLWTVMGAAGAMALGLVLLGVRLALGWTKPAPPPEDVHH